MCTVMCDLLFMRGDFCGKVLSDDVMLVLLRCCVALNVEVLK